MEGIECFTYIFYFIQNFNHLFFNYDNIKLPVLFFLVPELTRSLSPFLYYQLAAAGVFRFSV